MKLCVFVVLLVFSYVECRKTIPIDKNANAAFINMEGGGYRPPPNNLKPAAQANPVNAPNSNVKPEAQPPANPTTKPQTSEPMKPIAPLSPTKAPTNTPTQPHKTPTQITSKPVYPTPAVNPITTPGPGSVKQLVTFYDSQGKASPIRPYTYSQAVKQG